MEPRVRTIAEGLAQRAREVLPEPVARYVDQGSQYGVSASEATVAWDRCRFLPRVLRDVSTVSTASTLLGTPVACPVGIAPTTLQRAVDPDGEVAMAAGAADAGALMVLSSNAGSTFADVAATGVDWWLQMYLTVDRRSCLPLLERAAAAGAAAVVLTVDTPVVGTKRDEGPPVWDRVQPGWLRVNFADGAASADKARDLSPEDVSWLSQATGLPVVVKGVLRGDDARRCVEAGAAAVWVSNHGGRQLDRAAPTARCLSPVTAAVAGDAEVYVDGGIRDAGHVLAALAMGARACFLGRLPVHALAATGSAGVTELLQGMQRDLQEALTLAGCAAPGEAGPDLLE